MQGTWADGSGLYPSKHFSSLAAASKEECCSLCGLSAKCVAATLQRYPGKPAACHMHAYAPGQKLDKQANSTVCVTGRSPIALRMPQTEEELLNWGVE